uniref:Fibronectin type-III domain-containing protein n=2 Tax=Nothobranchius kuhntae TaxID=321403 RepID=A0A1A8I3Z9_NOTKU
MQRLTKIHTIFPLFLLGTDFLFANVVPPKNVTLHCHNLQNLLEWDYDQMLPGLRFRVDIKSDYGLKSCPGVVWVDQPPLQANLSFLSNPNAGYVLTVTAVIGQNESSPSSAIFFSYFYESLASQKCSLDLPPVSVNLLPDDHVQLRFEHPWLLYHEKLFICESQKKKKKERLPVFKYKVTVGKREHHHTFECEDRECEAKLRDGCVHRSNCTEAAQKKHCLRIKGELEKMQVKSQQSCTLPPAEGSSAGLNTGITVTIGLVLLAAAGLAVIAIMVFIKKTRPSSDLPTSILPSSRSNQSTMLMDSEPMATVQPSSPTPLLTNIDENDAEEFIHVGNGSTEQDFRIPIGITPNGHDGNMNNKKSEYLQGSKLEEGEEEEEEGENLSCPYERRPVPVELAPDERTEGYCG